MALSLCFIADNLGASTLKASMARSKMARKHWHIWSIIKLTILLGLVAAIIATLTVIVRTLQVPSPALDDSCSLLNASSTSFHQAITPSTVPNLIERFQQALTFKTITQAPKVYSSNETRRFIKFLRESFPLIHSSPLVQLITINELSLLYKVRGSNAQLRPYLLLAHLDVVPVQESSWSVPPFQGVLKDEHIYGRGALDLKGVVMGLMESLEFILATNTSIERSFFIALGHDEEGRGLDGAAEMARFMKAKGWSNVEFILDEGPFIYRQAIPGVQRDVAMVGVSEKGLVNIRLSSSGVVGHSSVPPPQTAIVRLARAVAKLDAYAHANQFGRGPERDMVESLAVYSSMPYRMLYANLWLFRPLVAWLLEGDKLMNSFIRTTTAVTIFHSGIKDNVLPGKAEATVNHRIYPLHRVSDVLSRDRDLIDDVSIDVQVLGVAIEPHPISPYHELAFGYQTIRKSIHQVFPNIAIIPGIMCAATDTRWYLNFTSNIYRFTPGYLRVQDFSIVHGHDERISKLNYLQLVNFYHHVILNANKPRLELPVVRDEF